MDKHILSLLELTQSLQQHVCFLTDQTQPQPDGVISAPILIGDSYLSPLAIAESRNVHGIWNMASSEFTGRTHIDRWRGR